MKHIVYTYGDGQPDEKDFDARGLFKFTKGDVVQKRGITWRIESVEWLGANDEKQIPTVRVHLTRVEGN